LEKFDEAAIELDEHLEQFELGLVTALEEQREPFVDDLTEELSGELPCLGLIRLLVVVKLSAEASEHNKQL